MAKITIADIEQARDRIAPHVMHTPLVEAEALAHEIGQPVWLKLETLQPAEGRDWREAEEAAHAAVLQSIEDHLISDVGYTVQLSGGVDSSVVVAMMCKAATGSVKTFSIGFDEPGYDESDPAREVARHLGTDHTERRVTPEDARALLPELPAMFDELEEFSNAEMRVAEEFRAGRVFAL